jgi:hypothetical protein
MKSLPFMILQLLVGSARLRALASGCVIGAIAHVLFARHEAGSLPPTMAAVVVFAGAASVVLFSVDHAPRRDRESLWRVAHQAVFFVGTGILLAMHVPAWMA